MNTTASSLTMTVSPSAAARRKWPKGLRIATRLIAGTLGCVAALAAGGFVYEEIASRGDEAAYPPAGELIDIGGSRLHLDCRGEGSPTIVMDAGLGGASRDWLLVQPQLATLSRTCVYDRAGMGWSDPAPGPRSPADIADELHRLLAAARIPGPYLLVGHSLAGKNVRMFAMAHPDEVAGMVLIDARSERVDMQATKAQFEGMNAAISAQGDLFGLLRKVGVARLFGAALTAEPLVPAVEAVELQLLQTTPKALEETRLEGLARAENDKELATQTLGTMPLAVIAASANVEGLPGWAEAQKALAALSSNGRLIVAQDSGHYVQLEKPDLVIATVGEVLADARNQN